MKAPPVPEMTEQDWFMVLGGMAAGMGTVFLILFMTAGQNRKKVLTWTNFWLVLSGVCHSWIELSFICCRDSFIRNGLDLYAAADFRYQNPMEAGTAAMEFITAILEGPWCILVAYGFIHSKRWAHPLCLLLCTCQLYGLVWFILHPMFSDEGMEGHFSSDPYLFWFIMVGMNSPWSIIPPILAWKSWNKICDALDQTKIKNT